MISHISLVRRTGPPSWFVSLFCVTMLHSNFGSRYPRNGGGTEGPFEQLYLIRAARNLSALFRRSSGVSLFVRAIPSFNPPSHPSATAPAVFFLFVTPDYSSHKPPSGGSRNLQTHNAPSFHLLARRPLTALSRTLQRTPQNHRFAAI
jgi:hypothetical protein